MFDEEKGWDDFEDAPDPDLNPDADTPEGDEPGDIPTDNIIDPDKLLPSLDDDPEPGSDDTKSDKDDPDNPDPDNESDGKGGDGTSDMSGIELYLSQFDIEGGMIAFDDGTSKHFDELDSAKQSEVLQQLHGSNATSVEEKFGLDKDEVGFINYMRTNKKSVQEVVEELASQRVATLLATQEAGSADFEAMPTDAVYMKFLKELEPEGTAEDLESKLQEAKKLSTYDKYVDTLRSKYSSEQKNVLKQAEDAEALKLATQLESQRKSVVETVQGINDIAGVQLDDNLKNSILDRVLEVNDDGDSLFLSEVFSDPEKLFKAAFFYYNGESVVTQRDAYWKKEKSAAYKRGRREALGVDSGESTSFIGSKSKKTDTGPVTRKQMDESDWDSIHSD